MSVEKPEPYGLEPENRKKRVRDVWTTMACVAGIPLLFGGVFGYWLDMTLKGALGIAPIAIALFLGGLTLIVGWVIASRR